MKISFVAFIGCGIEPRLDNSRAKGQPIAEAPEKNSDDIDDQGKSEVIEQSIALDQAMIINGRLESNFDPESHVYEIHYDSEVDNMLIDLGVTERKVEITANRMLVGKENP